MGYTDVGDYLRFDKMNMVGIDSVTFRTSGTSAGRIEIHADSPTGPLVATVPVTASGDWEQYLVQAPAAITDPGGTRDLYIVAATTGFDIDEFTFNGPGANGNAAPNLTANASRALRPGAAEGRLHGQRRRPRGHRGRLQLELRRRGRAGRHHGQRVLHVHPAAASTPPR